MRIDILLVEDNAGDARLVREVLNEINPNVRLHRVGDGVEAKEFLGFQGKYLDVPRPHLILLDLQMPRMGGLEFLAYIKSDPWLRTIPVIVLTTSDAEADIGQSYKLMASCYLKKPGEWDEFEKVVKSLNQFWLTSVTFHKSERTPTAV